MLLFVYGAGDEPVQSSEKRPLPFLSSMKVISPRPSAPPPGKAVLPG
jgi:hypothetical protein